MRNFLIIFFVILSYCMSAQVKYAVSTDVGIQTVSPAGVLDTITNANLLAGEYVAILTHSGTSAPTAQVMKNTIGTITWNYSTTGVYTGTVSSGMKFTEDKTSCLVTLQERGANPRTYAFGRTSDSVVTLTAMNSSLSPTDPGTDCTVVVRIEVYYQ